MGSSNFLPWDQPQTNMQDDATYAADPQRQNGGVDGSIFPSLLFNKQGLQASAWSYAWGQFFASRAFNVSDNNLPALVSSIQTLFANVPGRVQLQQLSYSPTLNLDVSKYLGFQIALSGNVGLTASGYGQGDLIAISFVQDGSGNHTVTWPSGWDLASYQPWGQRLSNSRLLVRVNADLSVSAITPVMSDAGIQNTAIGYGNPAVGEFTELIATGEAFLPTVAATDNSNFGATTAFVNAFSQLGFAFLPNTNGYLKLPTWLGGFTIQWGIATGLANNAPTTVNFPIAFATICFAVVANDNGPNASSGNPRTMGTTVVSTSQCTILASGSGASAFWIAIGR